MNLTYHILSVIGLLVAYEVIRHFASKYVHIHFGKI